MPTGTAGSAARKHPLQLVHYLRKRITYADNGVTITVGKLPPKASVIDGGLHVVTAFNGTGTDLVDVGFVSTTTDADAYATQLQANGVGYIVLDELAATTNIQNTIDSTVTCLYTDQNSNASAGVADVIVCYVVDNDG